MKDDNAYNFRVIDYGDSVQVRLYSTPVVRGGQVSKLDRLQLHDVSDDEFDEILEQKRQERQKIVYMLLLVRMNGSFL